MRKTSQAGSCGARSPSSGSIPGLCVLTVRLPAPTDLDVRVPASVPDSASRPPGLRRIGPYCPDLRKQAQLPGGDALKHMSGPDHSGSPFRPPYALDTNWPASTVRDS
ncbi:hypothetical protein GCM10020227_09320 [Streptomyces flavovirens]